MKQRWAGALLQEIQPSTQKHDLLLYCCLSASVAESHDSTAAAAAAMDDLICVRFVHFKERTVHCPSCVDICSLDCTNTSVYPTPSYYPGPLTPPRVQASTSGERVPARGGHTCVIADFQLVVFGGTFYKGNVRSSSFETCATNL